MRAVFAAVSMLLLPDLAAADPIVAPGDAIKPIPIAARAEQNIQNYIASLPFTLSPLGNFRITSLIGNQGLMLTNGPQDTDPDDRQVDVFVLAAPIVAVRGSRPELARDVFLTRRDMQILGLESEKRLTLGGIPAYEIIARVRNQNGVELRLAEWSVFGSNATLIVIATSRPELFVSVLPELAAVRDAIHLK